MNIICISLISGYCTYVCAYAINITDVIWRLPLVYFRCLLNWNGLYLTLSLFLHWRERKRKEAWKEREGEEEEEQKKMEEERILGILFHFQTCRFENEIIFLGSFPPPSFSVPLPPHLPRTQPWLCSKWHTKEAGFDREVFEWYWERGWRVTIWGKPPWQWCWAILHLHLLLCQAMLLVGSCVCERCLHQPGVHGVQKRHGESMESRLHPTEQVSQYAAQFSCYSLLQCYCLWSRVLLAVNN